MGYFDGDGAPRPWLPVRDFFKRSRPPHVHVFGQGGEAKIVLEGAGGIGLDWVAGIGRGDLRRIMQEIQRERGRLMAMWKQIHEG
jgi:hypothetical protein